MITFGEPAVQFPEYEYMGRDRNGDFLFESFSMVPSFWKTVPL